MTDNDDELDPPTPSVGDEVHRLTRMGLALIPVAGGTAVEWFGGVLAAPLERRRETWAQRVADSLRTLQNSRENIVSELQNDDEFVSVVVEATALALKTHEAMKLEMLHAAVVNAACGEEPDDARRAIYLRYVGDLTTWHLRLLELFHDPLVWQKKYGVQLGTLTMGSLSQSIERAFPELRGESEFYEHLWNELVAMGLVKKSGSLQMMMTASGSLQPRLTDSGMRFLQFVTAKEGDSGSP